MPQCPLGCRTGNPPPDTPLGYQNGRALVGLHKFAVHSALGAPLNTTSKLTCKHKTQTMHTCSIFTDNSNHQSHKHTLHTHAEHRSAHTRHLDKNSYQCLQEHKQFLRLRCRFLWNATTVPPSPSLHRCAQPCTHPNTHTCTLTHTLIETCPPFPHTLPRALPRTLHPHTPTHASHALSRLPHLSHLPRLCLSMLTYPSSEPRSGGAFGPLPLYLPYGPCNRNRTALLDFYSDT